MVYSVPNTFVAGNVIVAADMNTNFTGLSSQLSRLTLMHSGSGTTTSSSEEEFDTHTFSTNDFATTDGIVVFIEATPASSATNIAKVRVADSAATAEATVLETITNGKKKLTTLYVSQNEITNTKAFLGKTDVEITEAALNDADWITTNFTISLRGSVSSGTMHFNWWVYKRDTE